MSLEPVNIAEEFLSDLTLKGFSDWTVLTNVSQIPYQKANRKQPDSYAILVHPPSTSSQMERPP